MKHGISLTILAIIIIIISILATVVTFSAGDLITRSELNNFATNMSKIQDAVTSYYITRGALPILSNSTVFTKAELLAHVGTEKASALSAEIAINGDDESEFYYINVEKLNIENMVFDITATSNSLVVNSEGTHVYYLDGYDINEELYFSVTKDME